MRVTTRCRVRPRAQAIAECWRAGLHAWGTPVDAAPPAADRDREERALAVTPAAAQAIQQRVCHLTAR